MESVFHCGMLTTPTRRSFLRSASLAAATGHPLLTQAAHAQSIAAATKEGPSLFSAADLAHRAATLQTKPGNDNLFTPETLPFSIVLTTEQAKHAPLFEWHEGRDHILQVLAGATTYEVGGVPDHAQAVRTGEWLAKTSAGAITHVLQAGDMLVIPRGTPHRRSTEVTVTFLLFSTTGATPAP